MTATPKAPTLAAWLELFRLPNLFTVPGDPLAGCVLAVLALIVEPSSAQVAWTWWSILATAGCSLLLYMAGLVANDIFDAKADRAERPQRPIPSGRITIPAATVMAAFLTLGGLLLAYLAGATITLLTAVGLGVLILSYNAGVKRIPILGVLNMGLCRGLSVMVGASAVAGFEAFNLIPVLGFAGGLTLFIAAVTLVSRKETQASVGLRWLAPIVSAVIWVIATFAIFAPMLIASIPSTALVILAVGWVGRRCSQLRKARQPEVIQRSVGMLIRTLILMQCAVIAMVPVIGWCAAGVLLAGWPVSARLARRFYAS